jgi:hypothetical protein
LEAFRRRAADLAQFIRAQHWGIQKIHVNRADEQRPRIDGSLPNELILDSLYRRFRIFILEGEPANYRRFLSLLSQASSDEWLQSFLRSERRNFLTSDTLDFAFITAESKYRAEEVMDFWFNAYYFHDQQVDRDKLTSFERIVSAEGARVVLWETVWKASMKIRNLAWLVRDATLENPVVYLPLQDGELGRRNCGSGVMHKPSHAQKCPLCANPAEFHYADYENRKHFRCSTCTEFQISVRAETRLAKAPPEWKAGLSARAKKRPHGYTLVITIPSGPRPEGTGYQALTDEYLRNADLPR